jgi:uncharacterized membrane protein YeaQ/YmgE (transglycosylase-associated protein family)
MGLVTWIVLGLIAGVVASVVMGTRIGLVEAVVVGIVGAVVGGYLAGNLFHLADVTGLNGESLIVAIVGSIIVIYVWEQFGGRRRGYGRRWR